ncbi:MAG: hypothetical protein ACRDNF_06105, partial [Streptosporangiaceae bacterium]
AGVGGKAAVEIGRRLARLARLAQVIVVTHLPQVAAFADRHHVVVRSGDGSVTTSGVTALDEAGRLRELSRVLLAIEVVFAGADPVPTFVFDEVDAGVGGKAAVEIGRRLARLARLAQVIVVTHLPQVAAFADTHLVVEKADDGSVTRSGVMQLDQPSRVRELSRMLAGLEDSEYGRAHAEELLALATAERETGRPG